MGEYCFETRRAGIIPMSAARDYENPFLDCRVEALFTPPEGTVGPDGCPVKPVRREAYWDGGRDFKLSFAPTVAGTWHYQVHAPADSGLEGITGTVEAVPYSGDLAIYQHGFLRVSDDHRYLTYADGTPFFWLGDTHWGFVAGEKWDWSNHPQMDSMFRGMVDRRKAQKYTVYQTNLRATMEDYVPKEDDDPQFVRRMFATHYWVDGKAGVMPDVAFFQNEVDQRMHYIADAGLVNANGFTWAGSIIGHEEAHRNMAHYFIARYGALPMVYNLAGEIAGYMPEQREAAIAGWRRFGKYLKAIDADGYHQLVTVHSTTRRPFEDYYYGEDWHDFVMNQAGHGDYSLEPAVFRDFFATHIGKPFVEAESMYEGCSTLEPNGTRKCTPEMMRRVAYLSIQSGGCGYTYGAQGIWDHVLEKPEKLPMSGFNQFGVTWYEAIDFPGAASLQYMRELYERWGFWRLHPAQEIIGPDTSRPGLWAVAARLPYTSASENRDVVLCYYYPEEAGSFVIRELIDGASYTAEWFDPRTGAYEHYQDFTPADGQWIAPDRKDYGDWVLVVHTNA